MLFTTEEIVAMGHEEFVKHWKTGDIQASCLVNLGVYEIVEEDDKEPES